jgi:predicted aldo/keto reductase-like oxidoreductase
MGLTTFYLHGGVFDHAHEESSLQTIGRALDLGVNFLDTAWIYQVVIPSYLDFILFRHLVEVEILQMKSCLEKQFPDLAETNSSSLQNLELFLKTVNRECLEAKKQSDPNLLIHFRILAPLISTSCVS